MAAALVLEASDFGRGGSSPLIRTNFAVVMKWQTYWHESPAASALVVQVHSTAPMGK